MSLVRSIVFRSLVAYFERAPLSPGLADFLRAETPRIVITQSNSLIMEALLTSYTQRLGLAAPIHLTSADLSAPLGWCSLEDTPALTALTDADGDIQIATLSVFERRGPIFNNPQNRLSWPRLLSFIITARRLSVVVGLARPLGSLQRRSTKNLIRDLKLDFYRNLKLVRGTPFQAIETQEQLVLGGAEFERDVATLAARAKVSPAALHRQMSAEFRSIAAHPRRFLYSLAGRTCLFITKRLFSEVTTLGLDYLTTANREHTVVIVPMHRSHLDYIVVGCSLYASNLIPPVVAAGVNLRFGPFGFLIRGLGGYFVKRSARNDRIHAFVLRRYVSYLVRRGHLQEFFIEGGRSRSGRMRAPRLGLLSIMIQAFLRGQKREIQFIPVAITYENVVEDSSFGDENTGKSKKRESLQSLFAARDIFKRRYGQAVLNFGQPLSLRATVAAGHMAEKELIAQVGRELTTRIRTQTNPSLTSLAYTAILMSPTYGLSRAELSRTIHNLARLIAVSRSLEPTIGTETTSLTHFLEGRDGILDDLVRSGVVHRDVVLGTELFFIPGKRRFVADFYKNSTIHLFLPAAFLSIADLMGGGSKGQQMIHQLHGIFAHDYILSPLTPFTDHLARYHRALVEAQVCAPDGSFADRSTGLFVPALLWTPIQTLLWIFRNLENREAGLEGAISYSHLLSELQNDFRSAMYLRIVTRTEAGALSAIEAALEGLRDRGLISISEGSAETRELRLLGSLDADRVFLQQIDRTLRNLVYQARGGEGGPTAT